MNGETWDPVIICGPTASGKTRFAEQLSKELSSPIINADPSQALMYYEIGTGRVFNSKSIDYRISGVFHPDHHPTTYKMVARMRKEYDLIRSNGRTPIICGGSHHLIDRFIHGLESGPVPDPKLRSKLKIEEELYGSGHLHRKLSGIRPDLAEKVHPQNLHRILRYLEMALIDNRTPSVDRLDRTPRMIFIRDDIENIIARIRSRIEKMLTLGWKEEVRNICEMGFRDHLISKGPLGYKHVLGEIEGKIERDECIELVFNDTANLAKKQLRWEIKLKPDIVIKGEEEQTIHEILSIMDQHDE